MRQFINILENILLDEGVGLARRKSGEVFKNAAGKTLTFGSLTFYPNSGKFTDPQEMDAALKKAQASLNFPIDWTNPQAKNLAFAIARFIDDDGRDVYLGRYFKDIHANRNENNWPNTAIPGEYKFSSKTSEKENAGYKPSEILERFDNLSPGNIQDQVMKKFGEHSDELHAMSAFLAAKDFPVVIPRGNMNAEAFKQYFCELLQPIAFIKGMTITGSADKGIDAYIGKNTSLASATISFNPGATGGLSDSVLTAANGKTVKISTKEGLGAMASAKNLVESLREIDGTKYGKTIRKKYTEEVRILEILDKGTHYTGPLELAKYFDLMDSDETQQIMNIKAKKLGLGEEILGQNLLSAKLEGWYQDLLTKRKNTAVVPVHALMMIVADKVCDYVNTKTKFSDAASDILNHSAVLQVYTDASSTQSTITINGFSADYPGDAVTGVKLTFDKSYWSKGENGKITFKILKNNEKFIKPQSVDPEAPKLDSDKPVLVMPKKRVDIRLPGVIAKRGKTEKGLGRERR
jgi:hypothetical protein